MIFPERFNAFSVLFCRPATERQDHILSAFDLLMIGACASGMNNRSVPSIFGDKKLAGLGLLCLKEVSRCDPRAIAFSLHHLRREQIKKPKESQVQGCKGVEPFGPTPSR